MRGFGRLLQMVGLIVLPLASLLQLFVPTFSVGQMLLMMALGISAFGIGWILSTYRLS